MYCSLPRIFRWGEDDHYHMDAEYSGHFIEAFIVTWLLSLLREVRDIGPGDGPGFCHSGYATS